MELNEVQNYRPPPQGPANVRECLELGFGLNVGKPIADIANTQESLLNKMVADKITDAMSRSKCGETTKALADLFGAIVRDR